MRPLNRCWGRHRGSRPDQTVVTEWWNEMNRWRPVNKRDRNGNDKVEIARAPCRYNISGQDKPVARPLPAPPSPPPLRRRPNTAGDARALTIVAALVRLRALRTLTSVRVASHISSRPHVMWISPETKLAFVCVIIWFVLNLLELEIFRPVHYDLYGQNVSGGFWKSPNLLRPTLRASPASRAPSE